MAQHMAAPDYLTGLLKWLNRPEWAAGFQEVLQEHVGVVCEAADIEFGDLEHLLGEDAFLVLGACIAEDFFTRSAEDDGRNIVDDYLKRRGWKESVISKRYMQALRNSEMSLYEVSDILPGQSFLARDLLRDRPPVPVFDSAASRGLEPFDHIAARIFELNGKRVMSGGMLQLDPELTEELLEKIRAAKEKLRGLLKEWPRELPRETDVDEREALDSMAMTLAAPLISALWLEDQLDDEFFDADEPAVMDDDGDEVEFHDMHFPLLQGVLMDTVRSRLDAIPTLRAEPGSNLWHWLGPLRPASPDGTPPQVGVDIEYDDGVLLGIVRLDQTEVGLRTNSAERAATGLAWISAALDGLVGEPTTEITSWDEAIQDYDDDDDLDIDDDDGDNDVDMNDDRDGSVLPDIDLPPERRAEFLHSMMNKYYRKVLNEPVPMLGSISPRDAARTRSGRAKLVEWLKHLEQGSSTHQTDGNPLGSYDFGWMWTELGIENLRT